MSGSQENLDEDYIHRHFCTSKCNEPEVFCETELLSNDFKIRSGYLVDFLASCTKASFLH